MPVLTHERHSAVVEDGQDHRAAVMMDHFTLVREFAFAHRVDSDVEHAAGEDFLAADDLWQFFLRATHVGFFHSPIR